MLSSYIQHRRHCATGFLEDRLRNVRKRSTEHKVDTTSRTNTSVQSNTTKDSQWVTVSCMCPFTKMGYKNICSYCPLTARRALTLLAMFSTEHYTMLTLSWLSGDDTTLVLSQFLLNSDVPIYMQFNTVEEAFRRTNLDIFFHDGF